jgi:hypothetical protein
MTLYDNMAFGLKLAGAKKPEIDQAVKQAAKILHIDHLLDRKPKQLSGGQRQRVAIGRAITRKPKVFLFDEPLSNLDAALRVKMRLEFARLHDELKTTMIYVTHDQVEAMTLADKIVVLSGGAVQQVGTPNELYHAPSNQFVAGFIGSPKMNFLKGTVESADAGGVLVRFDSGATQRVAVDAAGLQRGGRDGRRAARASAGGRRGRRRGSADDGRRIARRRRVSVCGVAGRAGRADRAHSAARYVPQRRVAASACAGRALPSVRRTGARVPAPGRACEGGVSGVRALAGGADCSAAAPAR